MISSRSRYASSTLGLVDTTRGPVVTILPETPKSRAFDFTYMVLQEGDRLDLLAHRIFGDGSQWWRIADANPEILDWSQIPIGATLRVPGA